MQTFTPTTEQQDQLNRAESQEEYDSLIRAFEDEETTGAHPAEHDEELSTSERQTDEAIATASNGFAAAEQDAADLRAAIDAAHEANGTENPTEPETSARLQDDRSAAERLAGGEHLPQAADDTATAEMFPETLTGTGRLDFSVGGKKPTTSSITLTGGKIDVEGSYRKGETIRLEVTALVYDVGFVDKIDKKTHQATDSARRQKAMITGMSVID